MSIKNINGSEFELIRALRAIVMETMDYSSARALSSDSYLPFELIDQAQDALKAYDCNVAEKIEEVAA